METIDRRTDGRKQSPLRPRTCTNCGGAFETRATYAVYCGEKGKKSGARKRLLQRHPLKPPKPCKVSPGYDPVGRHAYWERMKLDPVALERHRLSGKLARQITREWLAAYKLERGCVDCGYKEHSAALQLDHEGEKRVSIANARSSIARLPAVPA